MKWFEKYPKLSSYKFTVENSGRTLHEPIIDVEACYPRWEILGYSESLPFYTHYKAVGILFENTSTFETMWFHYVYDDIILEVPTKLVIPTRIQR